MLATSPASATLVETLKRKHTIVASVITAAELLRAPLDKRKKLAQPFQNLVILPLLEPPLMLAQAAATAFLRNHTEYELSPTDQSRTIYSALCGLTDDQEVKGVNEWIAAMHEDVDKFIDEIRRSERDCRVTRDQRSFGAMTSLTLSWFSHWPGIYAWLDKTYGCSSRQATSGWPLLVRLRTR